MDSEIRQGPAQRLEHIYNVTRRNQDGRLTHTEGNQGRGHRLEGSEGSGAGSRGALRPDGRPG